MEQQQIVTLLTTLQSYLKQSHIHQSSEINEVAAALAQAQKTFNTPQASAKSMGESYATVDDIVQATAQQCAEHGLKLYQATDFVDEKCYLITRIIHSSGQYIGTRMRLTLGSTDKEMGAHIEFHRRHQMALLLGVGCAYADDNGLRQREKQVLQGMKSVYEKPQVSRNHETITKEQYEDILETLQDYPEIAQEVMEKYDITTLADMPKAHFPEDIKRIRKLIAEFHR